MTIKKIRNFLRKKKLFLKRKIVAFKKWLQPALTEGKFRTLIREHLRIQAGDVIFVHSSVDILNADFSVGRALEILLDEVGPKGTILFPTFPYDSTLDFLSSGKVFDIRKSPSMTGALSEYARRHKNAVRSLHPVRSVCGIGPSAQDILKDQHKSPFLFDKHSPFYKLVEYNAKVVGLGVDTNKLTFIHTVADHLGSNYPVDIYLNKIFQSRCIDSDGTTKIVPCYASNPEKMRHEPRAFFQKHVSESVVRDFQYLRRPCFVADCKPLFEDMIKLANRGHVIFPQSVWDRNPYAQ